MNRQPGLGIELAVFATFIERKQGDNQRGAAERGLPSCRLRENRRPAADVVLAPMSCPSMNQIAHDGFVSFLNNNEIKRPRARGLR